MNNIKFTNIQEFADIIHLTKNGLCRILRFKKYKTFKIKKHNGTYREINAPKFELKLIQKWILLNILEKIKISSNAMAFVKGKNGIKENAISHKGHKYILKLDLMNFYPSITFSMVKNMFIEAGYSEFESQVFTHFCTYKNELPQGGITSPYISNLIFKNIDEKIKKYSNKKNIIYTRYADDLIFSANDKDSLLKTKDYIYELINKHSRFKINVKKTKLLSSGRHQKITGITINNNELKVSKKIKQEVRMTLYNLFKNNEFNDKHNKQKLIGYIAFIHMIEDSDHNFHYINKCINYISKLMLKNNSAQDFGLLKILQNMK